jgi:cytoskeletal protein RodZ
MAEEFTDLQMNPEMTAGEMLRAARTTGRRKREIQTISKQLCIREEFLQALEDGDYTMLPETVYILGFARNYAMELGVDPDLIVAKIKRELGILKLAEAMVSHEKQEQSKPAVPVVAEKVEKKSVVGEKKSKTLAYVKKHWMWFVGGALAFVFVLIALVLILPSADEDMPTRTVVQVSAPQQVMTVEPKYSLEVREKFGTENAGKAEIVIQAVKESWVKIEDARGKTVFSRVLVPGDVYYVPAGNKHKGTFGNAGAIEVWVNNELVGKIGDDNVRKTGVVLDAEKLAKKKSDK